MDQFEELYTLCHDPAERDQFIDRLSTSLQARRRERTRPRILATVVSVLVALALTAGVIAWQQSRTSTVQRTEATARRVAALVDSLRYTDPATAMRLSVAAWRIAHTIETRSALIGALAQKEQDTFVPSGDEDSQHFMSPDTRTLFATGSKHVVRWDIRTHRRTGTFPGLGEDRALEASEISPDGRHLLLARATDSARVWDIASWPVRWGPYPPQPRIRGVRPQRAHTQYPGWA